MNRNCFKVNGRFVAVLMVALFTVCVGSGAVFATSHTSTSSAATKKTTSSTSSTASNSDSDLLSSEDWNVLLNTSSGENSQVASQPTAIASPLGDGTGKNSIFIWGIIAVGIGILGIVFFIYSQFIYKRMKKPVQNNKADPVNIKEPPTMPKRGDSYQEQVIKEQSVQKETKSTKQDDPVKSNSKTDDVDWDKFFEDHKNQNHEDK